MRYDYTGITNTADRLIDRFGLDAECETWIAGEKTVTHGKAVKDKISYQYMQAYQNMIEAGDVMLICSQSLDIQEGSTLSVGGENFLIIKSMPIKPADKVVAIEAIARAMA